ncbi:MAG: outer membrane beta-barrel protein, partial [Candidatus Binatia bacterium]
MKRTSMLRMAGMAVILALLLPASVTAQQRDERRQGRFSLGIDVGPQFGTADSTAFTLGFNGDYFLTHNLSVGPLLQVGLTDDLFQFGPSAQLKYTFDIDPRLKANLQGGIGFIYAELDRRGRDPHDTSFLIPVGPGLEYRVA